MKKILENLLELLDNNSLTRKNTGIPIVASCFNEEKESISLRNKKSNGNDDKDTHAECSLLERISNETELLVTIIPCEECLEKIIKHKSIKKIYYIGDYKDEVKFLKYDIKNPD